MNARATRETARASGVECGLQHLSAPFSEGDACRVLSVAHDGAMGILFHVRSHLHEPACHLLTSACLHELGSEGVVRYLLKSNWFAEDLAHDLRHVGIAEVFRNP